MLNITVPWFCTALIFPGQTGPQACADPGGGMGADATFRQYPDAPGHDRGACRGRQSEPSTTPSARPDPARIYLNSQPVVTSYEGIMRQTKAYARRRPSGPGEG